MSAFDDPSLDLTVSLKFRSPAPESFLGYRGFRVHPLQLEVGFGARGLGVPVGRSSVSVSVSHQDFSVVEGQDFVVRVWV